MEMSTPEHRALESVWYLTLSKLCYDTELGKSWLLFQLVWIVTSTALESLLLVLFFIIQQTVLVALYPELLLWWFKFLEFYLLGFCFVPDFIGLFMLSLSVVCGVIGFGCGDLFWILYFLELPALEMRRFGEWKGFWWADFKKLSTRLVKQSGSSFFLNCCCCVFFFLSIMACEMNTHAQPDYIAFVFWYAKFLAWLSGVNRDRQINHAHWEMMNDLGS